MKRASSRASMSAGFSLYASWKCFSALTLWRNLPSSTRPSFRWMEALTAFCVDPPRLLSSSSTRPCQSRLRSRKLICSCKSIIPSDPKLVEQPLLKDRLLTHAVGGYCIEPPSLATSDCAPSHWSLYFPVAPEPRQARAENPLSSWIASVFLGGLSTAYVDPRL